MLFKHLLRCSESLYASFMPSVKTTVLNSSSICRSDIFPTVNRLHLKSIRELGQFYLCCNNFIWCRMSTLCCLFTAICESIVGDLSYTLTNLESCEIGDRCWELPPVFCLDQVGCLDKVLVCLLRSGSWMLHWDTFKPSFFQNSFLSLDQLTRRLLLFTRFITSAFNIPVVYTTTQFEPSKR